MKTSVLILFVACSLFAQPACAKKSSAIFWKEGIGCWSKEGNKSISYLCFEGNAVHATVTNEKEREAFGAEGIFNANVKELIVLGFPGDGWPSTEYAAVCLYEFKYQAELLSLSGCSISGDWRREKKSTNARP